MRGYARKYVYLTYAQWLTQFDGGLEVAAERDIFLSGERYNIFTINGNDNSLELTETGISKKTAEAIINNPPNSNNVWNPYTMERDYGVLEVNSTWTKEKFEKRNPRAEVLEYEYEQKKKELREKEKMRRSVLDKLTKDEIKMLGINVEEYLLG